GFSTLAAAPPFHRPGQNDAPDGPRGHTQHGAAGSHGLGADRGVQRLLITFLGQPDRDGESDVLQTTAPVETAGDHVVDAAPGPQDHGLRPPWESASYGPPRYGDGFAGGGFGGGGFGGGGFGGGSGRGSSPGHAKGDGAAPGDPDQQTDAGLPGGPTTSD